MAANTPDYIPRRTPRTAWADPADVIELPLHSCHQPAEESAVTPRVAEEVALSLSKFGQRRPAVAHPHPEMPGNFLLPGSGPLLAGMDLLGFPTILCRLGGTLPRTPTPASGRGGRDEVAAWVVLLNDRREDAEPLAHADPIVISARQFDVFLSAISGAPTSRSPQGLPLLGKVGAMIKAILRSNGRDGHHDYADAFQAGFGDCLNADDPEKLASDAEVLKVFRNAADRLVRHASRNRAVAYEVDMPDGGLVDRDRRREAVRSAVEALRNLPGPDREVFTAFLQAEGDKARAAALLGMSCGHYRRKLLTALRRYGDADPDSA